MKKKITTLSNDIDIITAEINSYKQIEANAVFEIGKRLKHVKENNLIHGQWIPWLESVGISRFDASKYIRVHDHYEEFQMCGNMDKSKLFELLSVADKRGFIKKEHAIPSTGEVKKVEDMTRQELREVKNSLKPNGKHKVSPQEVSKNLKSENIRLSLENKSLKSELDRLKSREKEFEELEKEHEVLLSMLEKARKKAFVNDYSNRFSMETNGNLVYENVGAN